MDDITRIGVQFVPNDIKKEFGNSAYLMNAALNFIRDIEMIISQYEHLDKQISLFSQPISVLGIAMQRNKETLQKIISKQYIFEQQLNNFLGRSINFAWADNKGKILFADEVTARDIYSKAGVSTDKSKKYVGKVSSSVVKEKASTLPNFVDEKFQKLIQQRMAAHQALYQTVLSRWKENNNKSNPWTHEHKSTVYWQHPPEGVGDFNHPIWSWSGVVNQGHISQGYIDFIFNSRESLGASESDIGTFMMGQVSKDTVPGIVKGDVVVQNTNGKIQIAVKSSTFNTASIGPYLNVAYQIIELFDTIQELTIQKVQYILDNLGIYSENVIAAGKEKAQELIEDVARSTGAEVF